MTEPQQLTQPVVPRKVWYALVATCLSSLLIAVMAVILSGITQSRLEQRIDEQRLREDVQWCKLIVPIDERNKVQAPRTGDDKIVADVVRGLRTAYRCDEPSRREAMMIRTPASTDGSVVRSPQVSPSRKDR